MSPTLGAHLGVLFSLWLISSPLSHGYAGTPLMWNDVICGLLVLAICLVATRGDPRRDKIFSGWACALIGVWLMAAPLVFWAKTAVAYSNETILGILIALSGVIMASSSDYSLEKKTPRDWTYNPSNWNQRVPIITLAFLGFLTSRYMASYQLGHISEAWDPFFGNQTMTILESDVSRAFPVSDAGLGAFSYLVDAVSGAIGGRQRWRTMPWAVVLFGFLIVPPGVTSITLVILQPLVVGAWCSICLFTAVVMLIMVPPAVDEVIATFQFLNQERRAGRSVWDAFWRGASAPGEARVAATAEAPTGARALAERRVGPQIGRRAEMITAHEHSAEKERVTEIIRPSQLSRTLVACTLLGTLLFFLPDWLNLTSRASDNTYLVGAIVVTFAIIAQSEVCRPTRFINVLLGAWFALSLWILPGADVLDSIIGTGVGLAILLTSLPLGPVTQRYGTYDRWVRWRPFQKMAPLDTDRPSRAA